MTPIKPIENLRVKGVSSTRYPLNTVCAHPDCTAGAVDPHHCFPRSQIIGDSWFVEITGDEGQPVEDMTFKDMKPGVVYGGPFPHVTGLCRQHHEAVESHDAWIKFEDGQFNWYDRLVDENGYPAFSGIPGAQLKDDFFLLGPLNPQPGSREGRPKKAKRKQAEPGRPKAVYAVRVPKDELEDGHAVLTELVDQVRDKLGPELGWSDTVGAYFVLVAALVKALQT